MEDGMTLEQLRVFVAVAERQHVTKAAQALNLAQSAASNAIGVLEARHETKLFDRIGRTIELTEAGRCFWRRRERCWRAPRPLRRR
jgi:DNA-binding transcriptional LysR family regulator